MTEKWYYQSFGNTLGPVSLETLQELASSELLSPEDPVRPESSSEWRPAQTLRLFGGEGTAEVGETSTDELSFANDLSEFTLANDPTPRKAAVQTGSRSERTPKRSDPALDFELDDSIGTLRTTPRAATTDSKPAESRPLVEKPRMPAKPAAAAASGKTLSSDDDWYAKAMGYDLGPMPLEKLVILAQNGGLTNTDRVRPGANKPWIVPTEVHELASAISLWQMLGAAETVSESETVVSGSPTAPAVAHSRSPAASPPARSHAPAPPAIAAPPVSSVVVVNGQSFIEMLVQTPGSPPQRVLVPLQVAGAPAPLVAPMTPNFGVPANPMSMPVPMVAPPVATPTAVTAAASPIVDSDERPSSRSESSDLDDDEDEEDEERESRKKKAKKEKDGKWYCQIDGVEHGPVRFIELQRTAQMGRLKPTDQIRRAKSKDWVAASTEPTLFQKEAGAASIDLDSLIGSMSGPAGEAGKEKPAAVGSQGAGAAGPSKDVDNLIKSAALRARTLANQKNEPEEKTPLSEQLKEKWKLLAGLGLGILLVVGYMTTSGGSAKEDLRRVTTAYEDFKKVRAKKGTEDEFNAIEKKLRAEAPHLFKKPEPGEDKKVAVLKATVSNYFVKVLRDSRQKETQEESSFREFLARAEGTINGTPAAAESVPSGDAATAGPPVGAVP